LNISVNFEQQLELKKVLHSYQRERRQVKDMKDIKSMKNMRNIKDIKDTKNTEDTDTETYDYADEMKAL